MTDEKQENTGKADPVDPPKSTATASLPTLNFATFIFSLNSSALVQLGMIEDPMTGEKIQEPAAGQTDHRHPFHARRKDTGKPGRR